MKLRLALAGAFTLAAVSLAGCAQQVKAPTEVGACWHYVDDGKGGPAKFNRVASDQPSLEYCAARLERMRLAFAGLGGRTTLTGAYQGRWLFLERSGIWTGKSLKGNRYLALVRTGDGRLAMPGAIPRFPDPPSN